MCFWCVVWCAISFQCTTTKGSLFLDQHFIRKFVHSGGEKRWPVFVEAFFSQNFPKNILGDSQTSLISFQNFQRRKSEQFKSESVVFNFADSQTQETIGNITNTYPDFCRNYAPKCHRMVVVKFPQFSEFVWWFWCFVLVKERFYPN